jgi:ketosteroid isomerase-like protein
MADDNVELVRDAFGRFVETGELPMEVIHPEIEWKTQLESYRGHEGVRRWQHAIVENLGRMDIEMTEIEAVGEKVVADVAIKGTAQITGIEGAVTSSTVWTIRDGLVTRVEAFLDRDQALRAAES